jgi:nucleolar GTP-binding protein
MNFQKLLKVENSDYYLDVAIKRTKKRVDQFRGMRLKGSLLQKSKTIEIEKIEFLEQELREQLTKIPDSFPSIDSLPEFYQELINITLDIPYLKKSLASIKWCIEKNSEFLRLYKSKIKMTQELNTVNRHRRDFYGRVASTLKQIKPHLAYLELARKTMLEYPSIKTSMKTIAIVGFPNVGKSTLLSKLTPSKPKIAPYAFTTTGINQGFAELNGEKIQFIDTPGTLNRFEQQNTIERIATLAIKYLAEAIVYVFDLTETYPLEKQVKLYEIMKRSRKPVIVYLSKTDVVDEDSINEFKKKFKDAVTSIEELKEKLKEIKVF